MHAVRQNKPMLSPESALASEIFDQFVSASTFKSILNLHRQMCDTLRIKPSTFPSFYVKLKSKLRSWKAASLWSKLDKRANHKCYNRGKAAAGTRVLIIGAGPCGLRTAIEAQLLGAKVVVVEKRDRFSRNNVLHLWPFVIHDLRNLGAKKFYGKFCAGSIDHISIRQVQCILLKVALLLGVEVHENVGFESLVEPPLDQTQEKIGWRAAVVPSDHPVSQYEFGVLIGADGKRNTLSGFKKKEFRGKLAIAITANFINKHTLEEARIEEISGVAFIFNQKFFHDLRDATGIDLENIVYYKDETHYFVMTAKKQSLIYKGVIMNDYPDTIKLLSPENVDREALLAYAREAADFSTNFKLPHQDFAVNHYGQPDIAMFDFTSMYAAENASQVIERRGHKLLMGLVGDTLLEPFWPTGSGCARGFLSSFDAAWMIRSFACGKLSILQVLAERECVYRLLAQTTPENLSKDFNAYTLNPATRYPNLNVQKVQPGAVKLLYDSDIPFSERPTEIIIPSMALDEDSTVPLKRKRKDSILNPDMLLSWCQRQVRLYDVKVDNLTHSWKNGIALGSIIHRYRPDLIEVSSMVPENILKNNKLVFGILEKDYGIAPVMSAEEMEECVEPDQLAMISYLSQVYDVFKGEIPYVVRDTKDTSPDNEPALISPSKKGSTSSRSSLSHRAASKGHHKRQSLDKNAPSIDSAKKSRPSSASSKRRSIERGRMARLFPYQEHKDPNDAQKQALARLQEDPEQFRDRCKLLEDKIRHDFGMITREERQAMEDEVWKKKKPPMPIGKIERDQWNVKMLEEKLKALKDGKPVQREKKYHVDGSRLTQDIFNSKLQNMDAKLKSSGRDIPGERKYDQFDAKMKFLEKKLLVGPDLGPGVRGSNKVSSMATQYTKNVDKPAPPLAHYSKSYEDKPSCFPPINKSTSSKSVYLGLGVHGSEVCYFCQQRVYLMERMSAEGLFFHRGCFKCEYCGTSLRLGGYAFDRTKQFGGKFYCQTHFGMQRVERPKYTRHVLRSAVDGDTLSPLSPTNGALSPNRQLEVPTTANRGLTPERAEFENSYADMTSEDELSQLDEDEWTERNFGSSFEQDTSDDEYSDLSTDSDSSLEEEVERSLTVDETRRLAERWKRRYSQDTLIDVGGTTDEEIGSDTDTDVEGESDVFSSDEEYVTDPKECEKSVPEKERSSSDDKTPAAGSGSSSSTLDKEDKVKRHDESEYSSEDSYSSYSESEDEQAIPVQHEIPEIVIEEMLSKALNSDEEHLVPEAVQTFQAEDSVYNKEKLIRRSTEDIDGPLPKGNVVAVTSVAEKDSAITEKLLSRDDEQQSLHGEDPKVAEEMVNRDDQSQSLQKASDGVKVTEEVTVENEPRVEQTVDDHPTLTKETASEQIEPANVPSTTNDPPTVDSKSPWKSEATNDATNQDGVPSIGSNTIFIRTVTGPVKPPEPPRSRLGIMKAKCRDDERRHTSPVSILDIGRAKEEFLKCGGGDMKKRSASPIKKDALFKTLQSIEQLQKVLETPPLPPADRQRSNFGSGEGLDRLLQRSARSMSPEKKSTSDFMSRFRPSPLTDGTKYTTGTRGYILSKTASASCVPSSQQSTFPSAVSKAAEEEVSASLAKTSSASNIPVKLELKSKDTEGIKQTTDGVMNFSSPLSPKITLEPVFEDQTSSLHSEDKTKILIPEENLLSPTKKKSDNIMLDSESMSSTSTLNDDENFISYKCAPIVATSRGPPPSDVTKPAIDLDAYGLRIDDLETDDLSCSDWANDDLASACEDDIDVDFVTLDRFVTTRDKPLNCGRRPSWDDDNDVNGILSKPTQLIDDPDTFHAAFVQSISDDVTPVADGKTFSEVKTPIVDEVKSVESDDSLYRTPDSNMNTKYGGYTGNFARKISPFGSILDSVLKKKNDSVSSSTTDVEPSTEKLADPEPPAAEKLDRKSLKLQLLDFDKKIVRRRRSIHGDTPKSSAADEDELFFTPATSRKKCPDQRPWSVYGTPTETRKVLLPFESTPNNVKDATDFRLLTTVERDKLRSEARQRARLKSDEELGLSPSYYRRKYSSRTDSVSEHPEVSSAAADVAKHLNGEDKPEIHAAADRPDNVSSNSWESSTPIVPNKERDVELTCPTRMASRSSTKVNETGLPTVIDSLSSVSKPEQPTSFVCAGSSSVPKTPEADANANAKDLKVEEVPTTDSTLPVSKIEPTAPERKRIPLAEKQVHSSKPVETKGQSSAGNKSLTKRDSSKPPQNSKDVSSNLGKASSSENVLSDSSKPLGDSLADSSSRDSTLDGDGRSNTLERKKVKRKSFFSMLSLAKSSENVKKQEKQSSNSSAGESNPSTPVKGSGGGKERSFLRLKLNRSKEKFREKKKECDRGEALVPVVDDMSTPVTNVDVVVDNQTMPTTPNNKSDLVKGGSPPQASDDSFTESESKSPRFALSAEQLLNRSELTERIVTESLLGRRNTRDKEHEDRQQKLQKIAKRVQKQQEWKRHRLAQEIQRSLEELDVKRRQLEQQGVQLEKALRKQEGSKEKNSQVMNDWLNMVHQKNKLNNEEQDLLIRLKELQLEDRHSKLQKDLRSRMAIDDSLKDKAEIDEERKILKEMLELVEERDALVEVLEDNKQKQEKADKEFLAMMQSKSKASKQTT